MKGSILTTLFILCGLSSCLLPSDKGKVSLNLSSKDQEARDRNRSVRANVDQVKLVNDEIVITGSDLDGVTKVKVTQSGSDSLLSIVSKSATKLILSSSSKVALALNTLMTLTLEDAYGAAVIEVTFNLPDSSVSTAKIGDDQVTTAKIADGAITSVKLSSMGALTGQLLRWNGSSWVAADLDALTYAGTWDASVGGNPNPSAVGGEYYIVSNDGVSDPGDGNSRSWSQGDWIVYNDVTATWDQISNSSDVTSFNGRTGGIVPTTGDYTWAQIDKSTSSIGDISDVDLTTTAPSAGKILKYDGSQWVVGDDLSSGGAGSVSSSEIADGSIVDADVSGSAAIAWSKIDKTGATNSDVGLGNVDNIQQMPLSYLDQTVALGTDTNKVPSQNAVKTYVDNATSGMGTVTSITGGAALSDGPYTTTGTIDVQVDDSTIEVATDALQLKDGGITNAKINASAAIAWSKIDKTGASKTDVGLGNVDNIQQMPLSYLDQTVALGTDANKVPSQNAVKTYVDNQVGGVNQSQWTTNASDIYFNTGNVGIGTTSTGTSRTHINSNGAVNSKILEVSGSGVVGGQVGPFYGVHVDAPANNASTSRYGIYSRGSGGGGGSNYGIYGTTEMGSSTRLAVGVQGHVSVNSAATNNNPYLNTPVAGVMATATSTGTSSTATTTALLARNETEYGLASYGVFIDAIPGPTNVIPLSVNYNNSELMRVQSNGNLGIGTNSPSYLLDVNGSARVSNGIYLNNSSSGQGAFIFNAANESLRIGTNNLERMRIDESGNVGIGTTTPSTRLEVNGTITATGFNGPLTSTNTSVAAGSAASPSYTFSTDTDTGFYSGTADTIEVSVGGTNIFDMSSTSISSTSAGGGVLRTVASTAATPTFTFTGDEDTGWFSPAADELAASTGGVERVRISSNGRMGIGVSAPVVPLEVAGEIKASGGQIWSANSSTATSRALLLENYDDSANTNGIDFGIKLGGTEFQGLSWAQDTAWTSGSAASVKDASLNFGILRNNSPVQGMTLSSSGDVGIGTTTPTHRLTVSGGDFHLTDINSRLVLGPDGSERMYFKPMTVAGNQQDLTLFLGDDPANGNGERFIIKTWHPTTENQNNDDFVFDLGRTSGKRFFQINNGDAYLGIGTGNVGVGTTTPSSKLDVNGTVTATGFSGPISSSRVTADTGSAAAPSYTFSGDLNTGWFSPGADTLAAATAGTERIRIDNSGFVGIGTSTPLAALHVQGDIQLTDSTAAIQTGNRLTIGADYDATNATEHLSFQTRGLTRMTVHNGGNVGIGVTDPEEILHIDGALEIGGNETANNTRINFAASDDSNRFQIETDLDTSNTNDSLTLRSTLNANQMVWRGNGRVGIGTSAPAQLLHVNGGIKAANGEPTASNTSTSGFSFDGDTGMFSPSDGKLHFWSNNKGTFTIDNYYVGIGTQSPQRGLHIVGTGGVNDDFIIQSSADSATSGLFTFFKSRGTEAAPTAAANGDNIGGISFRGYNGSGFAAAADISVTALDDFSVTRKSNFNISTHDGSAMGSRIFIDGDGDIGINNSSPARTLSISGSVEVSGALGAAVADTFTGTTKQNYIYFPQDSGSSDPGLIMHETKGSGGDINEGVLHLSPSDDNALGDYVSIHGYNDPDLLKLHTDGTIEGVKDIYVSGNVVVGGSTVHSSDRRLKEEIHPLSESLEKILQLNGVSYYWKDREKRGHLKQMGLIAQEVQSEFPESVITNKEDGFLAVNYTSLIGPIIESIKELFSYGQENHREIASLKEENRLMKDRMEDLEKDNRELKAFLCEQNPQASLCSKLKK